VSRSLGARGKLGVKFESTEGCYYCTATTVLYWIRIIHALDQYSTAKRGLNEY
jgi:hypothetical protein